MVFGPAAMTVDDMEHSRDRFVQHPVLRQRQLAQRAHRIGGDVGAHLLEVLRMAIEQDSHVAFGQIGALVAERAAAQVQDECILAQHVAIPGSRSPHA
jgi:hypothetical protein